MAAKETSKNDPKKRRIEGWRCKSCGTNNATEVQTCAGNLHTRLLSPNPRGTGLRAHMTHTPCQEQK